MEDYFQNDKFVKELKPSDFDSINTFSLKNKKCWIVMFYAPWCGYCKRAAPLIREFAETSTFVDVGAFNCEKYKSHVAKMNIDSTDFITSYPTIIGYIDGKPYRFNGERDMKNLVNFAMTLCKK